MAINTDPKTFGYFLMVLSVIIAAGLFYSYRNLGRMKISYLVLVIICFATGLKFAFGTN